MKKQREDFLKLVNEAGMSFAYDKKHDILYFSREMEEELGCGGQIRGYWRESPIWNWIPQHMQEELVNMLRHEPRGNGPLTHRVPIRRSGGEQVWYGAEISILWNEDRRLEYYGVTGRLWRE